jgi:hypothetical protein
MHGTLNLQLCYTLMLLTVLAVLYWQRASWMKLILAPVITLPLMLLAALLIALTSGVFRMLLLLAQGLEVVFGLVVLLAVAYIGARALSDYEDGLGFFQRRGAVVDWLRTQAADGRDWTLQIQDWLRNLGRRLTERHEKEEGPAEGVITLAGVPVHPAAETKHFKLIGTTGTGKSTGIREMLAAALRRGDRAIFADPDGGYLARFFDASREDVILSPFDAQGRKWDPFAEIEEDPDIEALAHALIPDPADAEPIWSQHARSFLIQLLRQCLQTDCRDDRELLRLVVSAPLAELRELLAGTPAGPFVEAGNERMFGSIRSTASSGLTALEHTTRQKALPFSVRHWVRSGTGGALFLPYKAGEITALRTLISAWMRLAITEAMAQDEGDQRLWLVVDELDALGPIDGLKDALARLRKFGGRCVLGFQSIAQVRGTYGHAAGDTIVENCGSTLLLRCSASDKGGTSEFASTLIGDREVIQVTRSRTRSRGIGSSSTKSEQVRTERAVLASEIEQLPDLEGLLKLASNPHWQYVQLVPEDEVPRGRRRSTAAGPRPPAPAAPPGGSVPAAGVQARQRRRAPMPHPSQHQEGSTVAAPHATRRKPAPPRQEN